MTEQEKAQLLADWLAQPPGTPPPEGLDPDVVGAIWALRPDRAPSPRLSLDDVLDSVTEGPYARDAKVVAFPTAQQRAAAAAAPKPTRRPQRWVPVLALGLAAAAAAMIVIPMAGNLASPDRGADELSRMEEQAAAPATIPEAAPSADAPLAERDATVPADVVASDPVVAAPSAGPGAAPVATAEAPTERARADKDAEGELDDFTEDAAADAKPSPRPAAQNAAPPPPSPATGLDAVAGGSAGFGSAPGAAVPSGARGSGGASGGATGAASSTSTSTRTTSSTVTEEKRREQSERAVIAELEEAPAQAPAAPAPVVTQAPARSNQAQSAPAKSASAGRDEGAALGDAADDRAEEVQTLSKAKKESEPRRRLPKGDSAPASAPVAAPAAAPVAAAEVSTRASATPLDYDSAWYTRYADVVTAYDAAHAYEVAGAHPAAARAYAALVGDARVDVAQDAAWRGAKAWRAAGLHDQALALTQQGLRRSGANTVHRSNLLALQGDLYALGGRQADAEASWREAARLNAAR